MPSIDEQLGIDQCYCFAVRKASRQISRLYDSYLEPTGLRITQFLALAALVELQRASINTLAERLDVERTAMGKMAGTLERDGLVTIQPSVTDARNRIIELTEKGRQLEQTAAPFWREAQRQIEQLNGERNAVELREELRGLATAQAEAVL